MALFVLANVLLVETWSLCHTSSVAIEFAFKKRASVDIAFLTINLDTESRFNVTDPVASIITLILITDTSAPSVLFSVLNLAFVVVCDPKKLPVTIWLTILYLASVVYFLQISIQTIKPILSEVKIVVQRAIAIQFAIFKISFFNAIALFIIKLIVLNQSSMPMVYRSLKLADIKDSFLAQIIQYTMTSEATVSEVADV